MQIKFKKCEVAELAKLKSLSITTFSDAYAALNDPNDFQAYLKKAFSLVQLKKELDHPNSTFFFAIKDQDNLGYLKLNCDDAQTDIKDNVSMELERIYVMASYQRQGIGQQMLRFAERFAITKAKNYLWLGVWEHNHHAIRFYQKQGYIKFSEHPYFIGTDKQTDWLLKKELK